MLDGKGGEGEEQIYTSNAQREQTNMLNILETYGKSIHSPYRTSESVLVFTSGYIGTRSYRALFDAMGLIVYSDIDVFHSHRKKLREIDWIE